MKLDYTVQVGDFLLIHTTKHDAPLMKKQIESMTGLYSRYIMVYKREHEHLVKIIHSHTVINYNDETITNRKWLLGVIYHEIEENIALYEKRYKGELI